MAQVDVALYEDTNSGSSLSTLAEAFGVQWQDVKNGKGSFRLELPLGHADVALCAYGRVVRGGLASAARWAGVIDFVGPTPIDQRTEGIPSVLISGEGEASDLEAARVLPHPVGKAPGAMADITPRFDERPMEWYGPDFDDSSGWEDSVELGTHGEGSAVSPGLPGGMRVLGAKWIWLDGADDDFLFFREWVFLDEGFYCLDFCCYDAACFLNGRRHPRNAAYNAEAERVEFTVINSGYVLLAFEADLRDSAGYDPGLVWQITEGQEGPIVYASGSDMQVYGIPDAVLSMTAGEALLSVAESHPTMVDWSLDFTGSLDSDGNSLSATSAVTARIGADSFWSLLAALSEVYVDFDFSPTSKTVRIYEKGTKEASSALPVIAGGTVAAESGFVNVKGLEWSCERAPFNALIVTYSAGTFLWPSTLPDKPRFFHLGITHVDSGATAIEFADALLETVGVDQETATITLVQNLPDDQLPYVAFDKWSLLDIPSKDDLDVTVEMPVRTITCQGDAKGRLVTTVELGSLIEDRATRIERWIERSTRGGLSGLVQMAQGIQQDLQQRVPGLNQTDVKIIDITDATSKVGSSKSANMPGKGFLHKLYAMVNDATGGTSEIDVTVGGVTTTLSGTTAAGYQLLAMNEGLSIPYNPRTVYTGEVVSADHADITVYASVSPAR